jgi:hypothetical protein
LFSSVGCFVLVRQKRDLQVIKLNGRIQPFSLLMNHWEVNGFFFLA